MLHTSSKRNNGPQNQSSTPQKAGSAETCTMDPCPMKEKSNQERPEKCPRCGMRENQQGPKKGDTLS